MRVPRLLVVEATATGQITREYLAVLRVEISRDAGRETRAGLSHGPGRVVSLIVLGQVAMRALRVPRSRSRLRALGDPRRRAPRADRRSSVAVIGGMIETGFWQALVERYQAAQRPQMEVAATGPKPQVIERFAQAASI